MLNYEAFSADDIADDIFTNLLKNIYFKNGDKYTLIKNKKLNDLVDADIRFANDIYPNEYFRLDRAISAMITNGKFNFSLNGEDDFRITISHVVTGDVLAYDTKIKTDEDKYKLAVVISHFCTYCDMNLEKMIDYVVKGLDE